MLNVWSKLGDDFSNKIGIVASWWLGWFWSWGWLGSYGEKVFLYLSCFSIAVGVVSCVLNDDEGSVGINVAILSSDGASVAGLIMGYVCLFLFTGDLVFVCILRVRLFLETNLKPSFMSVDLNQAFD